MPAKSRSYITEKDLKKLSNTLIRKIIRGVRKTRKGKDNKLKKGEVDADSKKWKICYKGVY